MPPMFAAMTEDNVTKQNILVIIGIFGYITIMLVALQHYPMIGCQHHHKTTSTAELIDPAFSEETMKLLSEQYSQLSNQLIENWFFARNNSHNNWALQYKAYNQYRYSLSLNERFRDLLEPFRRQKADKLAQIIRQRIVHLQNPVGDCNSAKFAVCHLEQGCGFGCQIHHAAFCLMMSYAMGRTLVLKGSPWRYAPGRGFDAVFHQISETTEKCLPFINEQPTIEWNGGTNDQPNVSVILIPWVVAFVGRHQQPDVFPMAIPQDLADDMKAFHRQPFIWWAGLFLRYILRPRLATCQSLMTAIETSFNITMSNISQIKPLVGIHVRRSDKVGTEASYHSFSEYMAWASEYFDQLDYKLGHEVVRSVYIATDEPSVFEEAKRDFPGYKFYHDANIAKGAATWSRYSDDALNGILIDLIWLVRSDFIVCTFSSNICRLAFELLQTLHGDASDRFRSLDQMYFYWGQRNVEYEVVLPHFASNSDEISLKIGDRLYTSFWSSSNGNHYDGNFKAFNPLTSKEGLFPAYKVREIIYATTMMANFSNFIYDEDFQLQNDSCLLI